MNNQQRLELTTIQTEIKIFKKTIRRIEREHMKAFGKLPDSVKTKRAKKKAEFTEIMLDSAVCCIDDLVSELRRAMK